MATREIKMKLQAKKQEEAKRSYLSDIERHWDEVDEFVTSYINGKFAGEELEFEFKSEQAKMQWEELAKKNLENKEVFEYVQKWGNAMQIALREGFTIPQAAEQTSWIHLSLGYLQSNFFDTAVQLMSKYWKHGDVIQEWHVMMSNV